MVMGVTPSTDGPAAQTVPDLVARARAGDQEAWNDLVSQFLPLVFSIITKFRMSNADAKDVNATVWLRLVEHLDDLRESAALPGWLASTTRNEALRMLRRRNREPTVDPQIRAFAAEGSSSIEQDLFEEERRFALRQGLAQLRPERRDLVVLLIHDPPLPYAEIARRLGRPIGWVGPTRARALAELRATTALQALIQADQEKKTG
jgi:RNA polymerase sigma factor (sigma-70 family)